ncbi:histidinol-phosphate transaminase [Prolixibacteraceae bacterium Z1-6]|uniref:Aminotransferase n=1 Tax=Draconibacterium aestuarii TaxID=2998507 RepID=A0A9X3F2W4_9BACT|nr:histidinol-phosphate transaminase [Prolixibacteraceae bacterium Z1-6]
MKRLEINHHLFYETSHSPSLVDIVGEKMLGRVLDFCFIENPYYPGKRLLRKLKRKLPVVIKSYPSSNPTLAQKDLATVIHTHPNHIVIGNGATELITIIENQLVENIGIPIPTFSEYIEKLRSSDQVKLFQLPAENRYQLDLDEYAGWINAEGLSAALIINPGNPTGQFISTEKMLGFLEQMRDLQLILVDESFIDFAGEEVPSLIPFIEKYPNVIIVRSMSKHCGIPGLRLGYCCTSNADFLRKIRSALPIWNINTLAEYFLTQLKDTDREYHIARKKVIADVEDLYLKLKTIQGFEVYPTGSNFILLKITYGPTAYELQMKLLEEYGVYVRDCSNKVGLDKYHIRVASQGRKKDKFLLKALVELAG